MAPHSSPLAWKIPWTEEPGSLQSMRSRRVGHDWATSLSLFTFMHWRRKWQPTPVFLLEEPQRWRSLVNCRLWGATELEAGHDWRDLAAAAAVCVYQSHSLYPKLFFFPFQFWPTHGLLLGYFLPLCVTYTALNSPSNAFFCVNLLEKNLIYCGNLVTTWEVLDMGQKFCPPWTVNNKGLWDTNIWCLLWSSLLIVGREQSVSRYPQSFLFTPGKSWGKIIHEIPILLKSKTSVETQECCWLNSLT